MKAKTLSYRPDGGWSAPFPALDGPATLVVISADPVHAHRPILRDVVEAYPTSVLIGCAALPSAVHPGPLDAITVGVVAFEATVLLESIAQHPDDSRAAGQGIAQTLARPDLAAVLVLSAGVDGAAVASGMAEVLGTSAAVSSRFDRDWVLVGGHAAAGAVTAVGVYGSAVDVSRLNVRPPALHPADNTYRDVAGLIAISERADVRPTASAGLTPAC